SYSTDPGQFGTDHDEYKNWDVDFYACWNETDLFMGWVVKSDIHVGLDVSGEYADSSQWGWMWEYSCLQFILTPGAPDAKKPGTYQTSQWAGNYLEGGITLASDGETKKIAWSKPTNVSDLLSPNDWDCAIVRDDNAKTTTYEVRIPWNKTGVEEIGNGAQFGFTYAAAAQEHYDNVKKGMLEWQDAILGGKNADAAAVITLTGNKDIEITEVSYESNTPISLPEGTLPEVLDGQQVLYIDTVNSSIVGESSTLITDASATAGKNLRYSHNILLAPVEGKDNVYTIVESLVGTGEDVKFSSKIEKGMIVAAFHSDGAEGSKGAERRAAAAAIPVGTEVTVFGVDLKKGEQIYSNACLITGVYDIPGDESSEEPSE
ncbi:MAG: hypothetical protein KBS44_00430, partial [Clostridiales bacterium]|nr:hypothetical protein [Candidatus Coliplasma equi]